jgi:NSS family neurotransmitter:Na+ symporter
VNIEEPSNDQDRPTFVSGATAVLAMVGVAIGLGNFWRFPYLAGRYGGAAFVVFYLLVVLAIGVPGLMAEWALGRHTRRGTVGAFARAGLPLGRQIGWFFFAVVLAATAYYSVAVGWVLAFAVSAALRIIGVAWDPASVLPPETGFAPRSFLLQIATTGAVLATAALVLSRGLRRGIERASRVLIPMLFVALLALIARGLTLPGAGAGVEWYLLKFRLADLTPTVMVAALGQAMFSLALGGTFMVVYGSYLGRDTDLRRSAFVTAGADTAAGLLAGLAIFPAVFALGLEPASGPGLIFDTLPRAFAAMPAGAVFAVLLFGGLFMGALLSDIAALEVLVAGVTDNTAASRTAAVWGLAAAALLLATPAMVNLEIFTRWDLTFGSGMQTLGALLAALTVGWALDRGRALEELGRGGTRPFPVWLYYWIRFVIPAAILAVGVSWVVTDLLGSG